MIKGKVMDAAIAKFGEERLTDKLSAFVSAKGLDAAGDELGVGKATLSWTLMRNGIERVSFYAPRDTCVVAFSDDGTLVFHRGGNTMAAAKIKSALAAVGGLADDA